MEEEYIKKGKKKRDRGVRKEEKIRWGGGGESGREREREKGREREREGRVKVEGGERWEGERGGKETKRVHEHGQMLSCMKHNNRRIVMIIMKNLNLLNAHQAVCLCDDSYSTRLDHGGSRPQKWEHREEQSSQAVLFSKTPELTNAEGTALNRMRYKSLDAVLWEPLCSSRVFMPDKPAGRVRKFWSGDKKNFVWRW